MAFDEVIADAGYNSEANHRFCRETLGGHSLMPAKKRRSIKVIDHCKGRMKLPQNGRSKNPQMD